MNLKKRTTLAIASLMLVAGLSGGSGAVASSAGDRDRAAGPARTAASVAPIAPGRPAAAALAVSIDLCATTGSLTLPDAVTVPVWGYAPDACLGAPAQVPGPAIIVNEGDSVTVTLHNSLGEASSLLFQGQAMLPDTIGAPAGGTTSYSFTATAAGTYLYEAGPLANAQHQVAMGLFGALIVRPAVATQAYSSASTAFDSEAIVVLSEIDPALNGSASPSAFDMRTYAPRYRLINGQGYPNTSPIPATAGGRLLLRYLNAGMENHSMGVLGMHQTVIAIDGNPFAFSHRMVAETIAPGQTADTIVTVPAAAAAGGRFALFEGSMALRNADAPGMGGMLTFLTLAGAPGGPDMTGPVTTSVALVMNPGSADLTATINDTTAGGSNVTAAEYFIDTVGLTGSGTPMAGTFGTPTVNVSATLSPPSGDHTIYVRGQDSAGNWGPVNSVGLSLDTTGPAITASTLTPNPTNGTFEVFLSATGDDRATGNHNIVAAEYFIDGTGSEAPGSGIPMAVNQLAPVASLTATFGAATVNGLAEGMHVVSVRSQDDLGNWGAFMTALLSIDKTGPNTTASVNPTPNNGTIGTALNTQAVRVSATFIDSASNVSTGEGFIDTVGANGTGFPFVPSDGLFDAGTEAGYADIPLSTIALLQDGTHTIHVHGRDSAGNWGPMGTATLVIEKTPPVVSAVSATPNPTGGASTITLAATATDPAPSTNIVMAEWFEGIDPGVGSGTPMAADDSSFNSPSEGLTATIHVASWTLGNHRIYVRARDAAGNWSVPTSTVLEVSLTVPGLLRVTTVPGVPSQIEVDGLPMDDWALNWVKMLPGSYTVSYADLPGFTTPAPQAVNVVGGQVASLQGNFTQRGNLRVVTSPPVPSTITVDGVPSNDWGVWTDLPVASYQVCFGAVEGFDTPPCQTANLSAGVTTVITGSFNANASAPGPAAGFGLLRVQTSPAVPSQIIVDGVPRTDWGLDWVKLAPGTYTVSFTDVPNFSTPPAQVVTVTAGATTTVTGNFIQRGWLRVVTSPPVPGTISVDGFPRNDWGMWTSFEPGSYQVCFGPAADFTGTPACQTANVTAGLLASVTGSYTP